MPYPFGSPPCHVGKTDLHNALPTHLRAPALAVPVGREASITSPCCDGSTGLRPKARRRTARQSRPCHGRKGGQPGLRDCQEDSAAAFGSCPGRDGRQARRCRCHRGQARSHRAGGPTAGVHGCGSRKKDSWPRKSFNDFRAFASGIPVRRARAAIKSISSQPIGLRSKPVQVAAEQAIRERRGAGLARPLALSPSGGWRPQADSGGVTSAPAASRRARTPRARGRRSAGRACRPAAGPCRCRAACAARSAWRSGARASCSRS